MEIEYDLIKNARNIEQRGLDFSLVYEFDFENTLEVEQYINGEVRYQAIGWIGNRLYVLVYTLRGKIIRVISLRKANAREVKRYEQYF